MSIEEYPARLENGEFAVFIDDPSKPWCIGGGLTYGEAMLEPLADELARRFGASDVRIVPFKNGMDDPDRLRTAANGAHYLGHSAGGVAFAEAKPRGMLSTTMVDAVEPRTVPKLVAGDATLNWHQLATSSNPAIDIAGRLANFGAVWGKAEQLVYPYLLPTLFLPRVLGKISRTSTLDALTAMHKEGGTPAAAVYMTNGEFHFLPDEARLDRARQVGIKCLTLAGQHEFLTTEPATAISRIFG